MNEHYLHFLWKNKRLPFHKIKTTEGETVEFLHVGDYNEFESGPDFSMAKIRIDDLVWAGSIEIHVKSSDWYRHNHHLDKAYNNVILHVVYVCDKKVVVQGRTLPVIELMPHIDVDHFFKFNKIKVNRNTDFPCKTLFDEKYHLDLEKMKSQAIHDRLTRKTSEEQFSCFKSEESLFLNLTANAFGASVNGQPFEQLLNSFSLEELKNLDERTKKQILTNFFWKQKGLNAHSKPNKRLNQFLDLIKIYDFEFQFWNLPVSMIILYIEQQFKRAKINSPFLLNNFLINCIVRFIFWKANKLNDTKLLDKSTRLLLLISKESNRFTRKWEVLNIRPKNAFDSQALLEIYEQLCNRKACLDCEIGKKILIK